MNLMLSLSSWLRRVGYACSSCVWAVLTIVAPHTYAAAPVWTGPDGGDFLAGANWTLGTPGVADSAIINNDFDGAVMFSGSASTMDLFLRNVAGTITLDVDPYGVGNSFTMSRFTIVGAAAGETNHLVVESGDLETGIILVGNAAAADGNQVEVTGAETNWRATGGTGTTAAIRIGSNGGSSSSLTVSNGAHVESATQTIIGLQGASNNTILVTGAGSEYSNAQSISLGDNVAADKPDQSNNQLKVLDGGFITTRELIIGTTLKSPDNTVTVSGLGSRLNVRGGQQFPPTEGGQRHDVGRASSNNRLLIENGGVVDGNAIFLLGRDPTSLNNLLSVTDGSLSGWGIEIRQGKVLIDHGSIEISRAFDNLAHQYLGGSFLAETSQAEIDFHSGSLATVNASVSNGSVFTIGDGSASSATYRMKLNVQTGANGTHSFANGLVLSSNGILAGNGNVVGNVSGSAGGKVDVGASAGLIQVTGNWNNAGLAIALELDDLAASLTPGVQFDQLDITGQFTHGGTVTIDRSQLVAPATEQQVKLIGWGSQAGLSSSTVVSFLGGSPLAYSFQSDGLYLTVGGGGLMGDYNANGVVDAADYTVWRNTLNQTGTGLAADGDSNGVVNQADYALWKTHFGEGTGSASVAAGAAVPEPTTWGLALGLAAFGLRMRRRFACPGKDG